MGTRTALLPGAAVFAFALVSSGYAGQPGYSGQPASHGPPSSLATRIAAWYAQSPEHLILPTLALSRSEEPESPASAPAIPLEEAAPAEEERVNPFSFAITYTLASDYVSRGIVYTDYPTEGREKPSHQMGTDLGIDIGALLKREAGSYGTFGFSTLFYWFGPQDQIDPVKGQRELQEVDYTLSWAYEVKPIHTTTTLGYSIFNIPSWTTSSTQEWFLRLEHNDAWMWKWLWPDNEDGIVNPYYAFYYDTDLACGGMWMEAGLSHDFGLFENFTLTPNILFGIDHRYLGPISGTEDIGTRLATIQYGLVASYDLTTLMKLDQLNAGSVVLSGFLYFSDAVGTAERYGTIGDHLFGGTSISWSF